MKKEDIKFIFPKIETAVLKKFKLIYKEGEIQKRRNLLVFEFSQQNIFNFLQVELKSLKARDQVKILFFGTTIYK